MFNLLKTLYQRTEEIKGKRLLILLAGLFALFFIIGSGIGYINSLRLNNNELPDDNVEVGEVIPVVEYEGKVQYVDPRTFPNDKISYTLVDQKGKQIILLTAVDEKLAVAENLYVKVIGTVAKTTDNSKDVLVVEKVSIFNGTN